LTGESIDLLTDEQVQDIDQFILRFTKLQDTMGSRLFTSILNYLYEPVDNRAMLDVLHRLEKLGLIESTEMWQKVRIVRNRFAHDYANDPEKNAAQLNMAFASTIDLYNMLDAIRTWFRNAYPTLELGKELPKMPADA
jgi:type VI protein secretion system component VasF